MKPALLALATAAFVVPVNGAVDTPLVHNQRILHDPATPGVMVASHRACWQSTSENSLDGIRTCIAHGIDIIEIDARETADHQLVLMHDSTIDRMTNGTGKLSAITLADLRKLRLKPAMGGRGMTELTDRQVPTLQEALAAAKGRILINMDAKEPVQDRIFTEVEQAGMADQVIMKMRAAPDDPQLSESRFARRAMFIPVIFACDPKLTDGEFCATSLAPLIAGYARYRPVGYELIYSNSAFLAGDAANAAKRGRIWVNSLKPEMAGGVSDATALADPDGVWGRLIGQGATMIQTDHPEALLAYLRRHGLHR